MEDVPAKKRRIQFSLGTLLMSVITLGACMGFYLTYRENTRLRNENEKMRDEVGFLDVTDPEKAWICTVKTDVPHKWLRRLYVPKDGDYRIGYQTFEVGLNGIDRTKAEYTNFHLRRGSHVIELNIYKEYDAGRYFELKISGNHTWSGREIGGRFDWEKIGFSPRFHFREIENGIYPIPEKSSSFDLDKPQYLVAVKVLKIIKETRNPDGLAGQTELAITSEPGPGLLMWFERDPGDE